MNPARKITVIAITISATSLLFYLRGTIYASFLERIKIISPELHFNITRAEASLKKTANLLHFPYWFRKTRLPVYNLYIDEKDIYKISSILPNYDPEAKTGASPENFAFIDGFFASGDYRDKIEVRFRGHRPVHWESAKRSLLIKFPKDRLFEKMRSIDLIAPITKEYAALEIVNNYRLKEMGLVPTNLFLVWLKINGGDAGIYLAKERYSAEWLEKNGLPPNSEVFSQTGLDSSWSRDIYEQKESFAELDTLFSLLRETDDVFYKNIGNILDLNKIYRAIAFNVIAGGTHSQGQNLNFLFNGATGKLEPLLEDTAIFYGRNNKEPVEVYNEINVFSRRILSNENYYNDYKKVLREILSSISLEKDLALFDTLQSQIIVELYKDQAKYYPDFVFKEVFQEQRTSIIDNYQVAQKLAEAKELPVFSAEDFSKTTAQLVEGGEFSNFFDISKTGEEFIAANPQFFLSYSTSTRDPIGNLTLKTGTYAFRKNVVIPANFNFVIEQGTHLFLASGVSIVSYSPIKAIGSAEKLIIVERLYPKNAWGSIAVINTKESSRLENIIISGGSSSEEINGVTFTGMLAAHGAPIFIENAIFSLDADDDALNVKQTTGAVKNSKFYDTVGDAIDLDMTSNFVIENNKFFNIGTGPEGGDAIDISFGDPFINKNMIDKCSDKGVSVGEKSFPEITDNIIKKCEIGIAVKDESRALIKNNSVLNNTTGIALYQKKSIFGGGTAILENNILSGNLNDITQDKQSMIVR